MKNFETGEKLKGFTLVELIVVIGLVVIVAMLIYLPYRSTLRSFNLSTTKTSLQQNARIAMKKMVSELGAGMVVDTTDEPDDDDRPFIVDGNGADWIPKDGIDQSDTYTEGNPYFIIFYLPNTEIDDPDPSQPGGEIALYAALPDDDTAPVDPALTSEGERPLLYIRRYKYNKVTSIWEWEDPEPLIHQEENLKVTQLCFILGGDNQDRVLITLELAQEGPAPGEWRTYKLVATAKLGAR